VSGAAAKLGIIAGAGDMPRLLITACERKGRPHFTVAVDEFAAPVADPANHTRIPISKIGATIAALKRKGCSEVVFAGKLQRPDGDKVRLRPDWGGLMFLLRVIRLGRNDDVLHRAIEGQLRSHGLKVVSPLQVAPELAAAVGCLTRAHPTETVRATFSAALQLAKQHGQTKRGQAVVVENGAVIASEERAGTDAMLALLDRTPRPNAILVKAMAPNQLPTIDPPAIGANTIVNAASAGLAGILIEAGRSVVVEEARVRELADQYGIFVYADSIAA
jgi:DUF1009 family protein